MTLSRTGPAPAASRAPGDRLSREILVLSAVVVLGTIMTVLDLTIVNVPGQGHFVRHPRT